MPVQEFCHKIARLVLKSAAEGTLLVRGFLPMREVWTSKPKQGCKTACAETH